MTTNYTQVTESVKAALAADKSADNKWSGAAKDIREFFGSPEELLKVKVQFCADVILHYIDKRHRDALALNVKDTDAKSPEGIAVRKAKKDATATRDTMFMYVLKKAWPEYGKKDDAGADKPDASESDKIRKVIADLIARIQKKEELDFDVAATLGFLNKAATAATKKN